MKENGFQEVEPGRQGIFVSDLHVFSGRSVGESLGNGLQANHRRANLLVLGGDIFDFKWSSMTAAGTLLAAEKWLQSLLQQWDGEVVFLAGNHDCAPNFLQVLQEVASRNARFTWHDHQVQMGDSLFLHGDVLDAGQHVSQLASYRDKFHPFSHQSKISRQAYSALVAMRIHRMAPKLRHRPTLTGLKLHRLLPQLVERPEEVRQVFYGHTHVGVGGLEVNGVSFSNPGAAIRHIEFKPIEFTLNGVDKNQNR